MAFDKIYNYKMMQNHFNGNWNHANGNFKKITMEIEIEQQKERTFVEINIIGSEEVSFCCLKQILKLRWQ